VADRDGTERKVYVLPVELSERIKAYQLSQGIASEVEAARRLLDSALQMRDTELDILKKLKSRYEEEKDLRVLARDILTSHVLVTDIYIGDTDITFRLRSGMFGSINKDGKIFSGDERESLEVVRERFVPPQRQGPSWEAEVPKKKGDLDDEIPF